MAANSEALVFSIWRPMIDLASVVARFQTAISVSMAVSNPASNQPNGTMRSISQRLLKAAH